MAPPLGGATLCPRSALALLFELAFDRVAVALRASTGGLALGLGLRLPGLRLPLLAGLLLLIHDLADLRRGLTERVRRGADPLGVVGLERVA